MPKGVPLTLAQREKVLDLLKRHPNKSYPKIGKLAGGISNTAVWRVYKENKDSIPTRTSHFSKFAGEQLEELDILHQEGVPINELADHFDVTRETIWWRLKQRGLEPRKPTNVRQLSEEQQGELSRLYLEGKRVKDIAGHFSISGTTVKDYVDMLGLERKHITPEMDKTNLRRMHSPLVDIVSSGGRAVDAFRGKSKAIRQKAIKAAIGRAKTRREIVQLVLAGAGNEEIAKKTGLTVASVYNLKKRFLPDIEDALTARERIQKWRRVFREKLVRTVPEYLGDRQFISAAQRCYDLRAQSYVTAVITKAYKAGEIRQALEIRDIILRRGLKPTPVTTLFFKSDLWKRLKAMKK